MRKIFLITLTSLVIFTVWGQDAEALKKDQARLQGDWVMVSGERAGQKFPADFLKNSTRSARGDETTVMIQGQLFMKAKFILDPSKNPKTIDYSIVAGNYAGMTELGIYEFDGDKVKFCFSVPGKERPADFITKPEDGRTLSIWKKATK